MIKRLTLTGQLACLLILFSHRLLAQVPQVASRIHFAGMELHLNEQARRDIQSSVDALYRSEKHFNLMLERVDLYMPVIEPILLEYGVPKEFKYLVIQESALIPDAVSSSNAVGYWQFKESSATELGLRVDRQVDERMNIISATEGAAKYLLRSNAEFDNWVYSLQSYLMGQGGASRSVDKRHYGARQMKIDGNTHWYVKKFLSHLVAFENAIGQQNRPTVLYPYTSTQNKSLKQIAHEFDTDEEELLAYNKWLKTSRIPEDKPYTVIIPLNIENSEDLLATADQKTNKNTGHQNDNLAYGHKQQQPEKPLTPNDKLVIVEMNDLKGIIARPGDQLSTLAEAGNVSEKRFKKFNDLGPRDAIQPGRFYYLEKKRRKARVYEHVAQPNESLWDIAQRYGVRLDKLRQKNRMASNEQLKAGRVVWLRFIRPSSEAIEYRPVKEPKESLYASTKTQATETPVTPTQQRTKASPASAASEEAQGHTKVEMQNGSQADPLNKVSETSGDSIANRNNHQNSTSGSSTAPDKEAGDSLDSTHQPAPSAGSAGIQQDLLYPADTPVNQQPPIREKPLQNTTAIKDVQKDTLNRQNESRNIPAENKRKSLYPESQPSAEEAFTDRQETSDGSFLVDIPVNFIEEKEETPRAERLHEVQPGETLYALSKKYGVSVQDLIKWNELPSQPVLSIGQQLRLSPASDSSSTAGSPPYFQEKTAKTEAETASSTMQKNNYRYHVVSAGESMYRVARQYNVTIKDIMQWNNKENFDIREGEQLIVGNTAE